MCDLVLSDAEDLRDGNLYITYRPSKQQFEFHHRAFSGHKDRKICTEAEGLQTLRMFLRVKYGILFEIP